MKNQNSILADRRRKFFSPINSKVRSFKTSQTSIPYDVTPFITIKTPRSTVAFPFPSFSTIYHSFSLPLPILLPNKKTTRVSHRKSKEQRCLTHQVTNRIITQHACCKSK